jgi:uncharacterized protein (DUF697 family)
MPQPILEELAQQGDADAIAALLNRTFAPEGISAKVATRGDRLHVVLDASETPQKEEAIASLRAVLTNLALDWLETVVVYGRRSGEEIPDWHEQFVLVDVPSGLTTEQAETQNSLSFSAMAQIVGGVGDSIGTTTARAGKAMVNTASDVGETVGNLTFTTGKDVLERASDVGESVGNRVWQTGKDLVRKTPSFGEAMASVGGALGDASQFGKNAVQKAVGASGSALKRSYQLLSQVTQFVAGAPVLRKVVGQVDLIKAQQSAQELQDEHPEETPRQLAHRFMVEKAMYAGSSGLVTNLVPGAAAALFAVDLTTTAALQAEMVYQIAAVYGLDLQDPARKGEVLTIFGVALGGNQALRAGLEFLQTIPMAGAAIGASTNAAMIYAVGYAACRFYESELAAEPTEEILVESQEASEDYLQNAIAQQIVMDQILVHVIAAGNPDKSWADILPELETSNLSPASLAVIKARSQSPPPLEELLAQLDRDFATSLLAQCQRLAPPEGAATPEQAQAIEMISQKFQIDLDESGTSGTGHRARKAIDTSDR